MGNKESKILLVDDDELNRRMMGLLLSEKGYNYDTASNGLEAVEAIQSELYDLVLMDLQMPLMDGYDATRKIREWEADEHHTPIVALTAMLFDNEIQKCLSAGMDECVAKPFDTETLFRLIDSYVNKVNLPNARYELKEFTHIEAPMVLNVQGALPRFGKDVQLYNEFLNEFIGDLENRVEGFRRAFLAGDFQVLADGAHSLKGIAASMGAEHFAHLLEMLDQNCIGKDSLLIQQTLEETEKHALVLRDEAYNILHEYINKPNE